MMPLKTFDGYLKEGTAKKQSPDVLRARSLVIEAADSYRILLSCEKPLHSCSGFFDISMPLL